MVLLLCAASASKHGPARPSRTHVATTMILHHVHRLLRLCAPPSAPRRRRRRSPTTHAIATVHTWLLVRATPTHAIAPWEWCAHQRPHVWANVIPLGKSRRAGHSNGRSRRGWGSHPLDPPRHVTTLGAAARAQGLGFRGWGIRLEFQEARVRALGLRA